MVINEWTDSSGTHLLEAPTIYKAYFLELCQGISPEYVALYGAVPPFSDSEILIDLTTKHGDSMGVDHFSLVMLPREI